MNCDDNMMIVDDDSIGAKPKTIGGSVVYRYSPRPGTIYLNITNQCSNSCTFCVKNYSSGLSGHMLWLDREPTIEEIWSEIQQEVKKSDNEVAYCGFGEPTIRLDTVLELTRRIRGEYPHLKIRLDTDGLAQLRNKEREVAGELRRAGVDSVSISLNADNKENYDILCKPSLEGSYQAVLAFAEDCRKHFSQVQLTAVNIPGVDLSKCQQIAMGLGCDFRVR